MNHTQLSLSVLTASVLAVMSVATAHAETELPSTTLQTITVTATTAFDDQVRGITSDKLDDMQANGIKDVLKTLPSITVDGNTRYSNKVYVRGLEDKFSNITVDGARMTGQLFHHSGDQTIDADMIKVAEIELGPNSALSGPGVVNGSFKYETKDPSDLLEPGQNFGGKVSAGYESGYDRTKGSVSLYGQSGMVGGLVSANYVDDKTVKTPVIDENSKQSELQSGLAKLVLTPTEDTRFSFGYNLYQDGGNRDLSAEKPGSTSNDESYKEIKRKTITATAEYTPNDWVNLTAKAYTNSQQLNMDSYRSEPGRARSNDPACRRGACYAVFADRTYENKVNGFDVRNISYVNDNHQLTYGIEGSKEEQSKDYDGDTKFYLNADDSFVNESNESFTGDSTLKHYGVYAEDEMNFGDLTVNLGARYDNYKLGGVYSGTFDKVTPKLKASYQTTDKLKLRMGYGSIFRGPQLGETLMIGNDMVQVDNVEASTGYNAEVGFDYDLSDALNADRSLLSMTAYQTELDNYAHPTKNTSLDSKGDYKGYGIETVLSHHEGPLNVSLSHTYTDGQLQDKDSGLEHDVTTAKIHTVKFSTSYQFNDEFGLNYNGQYVPSNSFEALAGGRRGQPYSLEKVDRSGYVVHNVGMTYEPKAIDGLKLNFGIDNLADAKYTPHTAFGTNFGNSDYTSYEVGRNFKVQASYKF